MSRVLVWGRDWGLEFRFRVKFICNGCLGVILLCPFPLSPPLTPSLGLVEYISITSLSPRSTTFMLPVRAGEDRPHDSARCPEEVWSLGIFWGEKVSGVLVCVVEWCCVKLLHEANLAKFYVILVYRIAEDERTLYTILYACTQHNLLTSFTPCSSTWFLFGSFFSQFKLLLSSIGVYSPLTAYTNTSDMLSNDRVVSKVVENSAIGL